MALADLHVHSTCSADGSSTIADYARRATRLGLAEVGFCEHADFDPRDRSYGTLDLARYDRELAEAQAIAPGVRLRQGVEITFQANLAAGIGAWLGQHTWDYVVMSVHLLDYCDGWAIVSERDTVNAYFRSHSLRQACLPYFEELLRAVQSGLGDVLGHFDLVKRYGTQTYGPFEPGTFEEEIREVLRAMVGCGMALEVNTSGLRQGPGEPYPGLTVLRWYRDMGGELVTLGSDAHDTHHLGAGLPEGAALARAAGLRWLASFDRRQVQSLDLDDRGGSPLWYGPR
jgi:histidinol-phosphatase (PHP family)